LNRKKESSYKRTWIHICPI